MVPNVVAVLQSVPSTPPSVPRTNGAVTTWLMAEHHATPWDGGRLIWDVLSTTTHLGYDTHTRALMTNRICARIYG